MFAKLYGTDDDQVLVVFDEGDNGPEVRVSTVPEGFGVCSMAAGFDDNDDGWERAQQAFDAMDEATARHFADGILRAVSDP